MAGQTTPTSQPSFQIGHLDHPPLCESSGIVASRISPGVFWTHNDSGNAPVLYAVTREGNLIAEYPVKAFNRDWEDIAIDDDGHLYIGEIGNNNGHFNQLAVYQVDEPKDVAPRKADDSSPSPLIVRKSWQLRFPGRPFDCESLFVYKGWGYVISKLLDGEKAGLYRFPLVEQKYPAVLDLVTTLPIHAPVTAADLSPDGKRLAVMTVAGPYLFQVDGDPAAAGRAKPSHVSFFQLDMEAVCFVPEGLLATTESRMVLLFRWPMFGGPTTQPK